MDSFFAWVGGKKLLRKEICNHFPVKLDKYIEVFGGAAWVLFYKDRHAPIEVYNDINGNLVNLFKCVKYHPNAVEDELSLMLNARELFQNSKELYNVSALTEIQRAAQYLYLIKSSYASKAKHFGAKAQNTTNTGSLKIVKERLKSVIIENKSFDALIQQYDKGNCLFYCDPPYYEAEGMYDMVGHVFDGVQHIKLYDCLCSMRGRFILSYNDSEFIRRLYHNFNIYTVERTNNLANRYGAGNIYQELIIKNY